MVVYLRMWVYRCGLYTYLSPFCSSSFPPSHIIPHTPHCANKIYHNKQVHDPHSPTYETEHGEGDHHWWDMKHREDALALLTAILLLRVFKVRS